MSSSEDEMLESDCVLPSGNLRFVQAEQIVDDLKKLTPWDRRRVTQRRKAQMNRNFRIKQLNHNSLFKWSAENHHRTIQGKEKIEKEKKKNSVDDVSPF